MYLHLGQGTVVPFENVIGVFDLDNATYQKKTRDTLEQMEERGQLHVLGQRLPVSLVVTDEGVYLSPISPAMLCRRLGEERWE